MANNWLYTLVSTPIKLSVIRLSRRVFYFIISEGVRGHNCRMVVWLYISLDLIFRKQKLYGLSIPLIVLGGWITTVITHVQLASSSLTIESSNSRTYQN